MTVTRSVFGCVCGGDVIAIRKLKAHHERAFFRWVAFERAIFAPAGKAAGPVFHSIAVGA